MLKTFDDIHHFIWWGQNSIVIIQVINKQSVWKESGPVYLENSSTLLQPIQIKQNVSENM